MTMDVRDMSAFQTGSFDAIVDKGSLLYAQHLGCLLFLFWLFISFADVFFYNCFVWSFRDSRLSSGECCMFVMIQSLLKSCL